MKPTLSDLAIDPSRLRADRPPPRSWKDIPIVEPKAIVTEGLRWVAVRTAPKCERLVAAELSSLGYSSYCPLGAKFVYWQDNKCANRRLIKQLPVFFGYIFVGLLDGQQIGKYTVLGKTMVLCEKIHSVLSNDRGPLTIPIRVIAEINKRELSNQWDETKKEVPTFKRDDCIRVTRGAFMDFEATVDEMTSEGRIRALLAIFGRQTIVDLDVGDVKRVKAKNVR